MDQAQIRESPPATDRHPNHWATPPTSISEYRPTATVQAHIFGKGDENGEIKGGRRGKRREWEAEKGRGIQKPWRWRTTVSAIVHLYCWYPWSTGMHCVLPEPISWLCLQLDFPPSVADLSRLPPLKSGILYRNGSSQTLSARTLQFAGVTLNVFTARIFCV